MPLSPMRIFAKFIPSKVAHPDGIEKNCEVSSTSIKQVNHGLFDWETLDDPLTETKCPAWETLSNALHGEETMLVTIANSFSLRCILHEVISLDAPNHVLMQLADRFPASLDEVDGNGRYPVHVACIFGASSEFVSLCIAANPFSAASEDVEGKTPAHLLCQGTFRDFWDIKHSLAAKKNMAEILWALYVKAPSSVVSEDNYGVGCIEYALVSNLGIDAIADLQDMIVHFNENQAPERSRRRCMAACRQLQRKNSFNDSAISFASDSPLNTIYEN